MKYIFTQLLLSLIFLLYYLPANAQKDVTPSGIGVVTGVVTDKTLNEPIPYVTVAIKSVESGEIVGGQITDGKGRFTVEDLPQGDYAVEFQYIGYQKLSQTITIADGSERVNLSDIYLSEDVTLLDGVEVVAERSTIEQRVDRKVINIGKDLSTTGPTAADLMVNIPSVNVDQDGGISLRGNENVRILVDGKPTNLSASQLLQQIPSASIKKIELITNPSAKFIPDGMSGIINIVLHKNTNLGLNGNTSTGFTIGQEYRFSGSGDINYRTEKVNVFANYGNNHGQNPIYGRITRPGDPSNEVWTFMDDPTSHLVKTGVDYFVSDRTVLSAYTVQNKFDNLASRFTIIQFPEDESANFSQQYVSDVSNRTSTYNFDIKHQFSGEGRQIEFEMDYSVYEGDDAATFRFEEANVASGNAEELIHINRKNTTINLDYTHPITGGKKLELGAEARVQRTDNSYLTTNPGINSAQYDFDRDIYSGYLSYSHNMSKWSYQIGARLEGFDMIGFLEESGEPNQRFDSPIFSIYPSAFLSYVPDPEKQRDAFNLSVSRRVDRPNLDQINPIRVWSSPRITNIGNPALIPQFTNSVEFNYTRQLKEGSVTTGIFFRKIYDEITRFGFNDPENPENIFFSYNNYQDNSSYGFELSGNYKLTSFWSFTSSFDIYSQKQRGVAQDEFREVQNVLYNFRMNHSLKASKKLTFQVVSLYRGAYTNLQYRRLAFHFINIGGRYTVLKGNGTVSVNFNDIFKTQQNSFVGERPVVQEGVFDWDSRTLFVGYSHRFGTGKGQSLKRKKRDKNETRSGGF
ncbi:MAG: TonB-dependent receptor [Cyclobacteriaceae bacterium]